jgi:hypothetical protein
VRESEEAEYVVTARKVQHVLLRLGSAHPRSPSLRVVGPDLNQIKLSYGGRESWSAFLPQPGDYLSLPTKLTCGG